MSETRLLFVLALQYKTGTRNCTFKCSHLLQYLYRTYFQVPIVREQKSKVYLTVPQSRSNCTKLETEVPRITCSDEELDESFCYEQLELEEGQQELQECEVSFKKEGARGGGQEQLNKVCSNVGFKVPKTVCKDRPGPFIEFD